MAQPTLAQIQASEKDCVDFLEQNKRYGNANAKNVVAMIQAAQASAIGDYAAALLAALDSLRATAAYLTSPAGAATLLYPHLLHLGRLLGWPETSPSDLMGRRYLYYVANALTVQSRVLTKGAVTAGGGNVGTGTIYRLTKDENDFVIEATTPEVKTFECLSDANLGTSTGQEQFEAKGLPRAKDSLEIVGSGMLDYVNALSGLDTVNFLQNPSFSSYTPNPYGAGPLTALPGWSDTAAFANISIVTGGANYYRDADGDTAQAAIQFNGNAKITQAFSVSAAKLAPNVPYHIQIAFQRVGAADGTLTLRLGSQSVAVVLAAQVGWNILTFALDKTRWPKNFNQAALQVEIEWSGRSAGQLQIDDTVFAPMRQLDGDWYAIVGGATAFLKADVFTFTDSQADATKGLKQFWFGRAWGHYLPYTTGAATDADP